MTALRVQDLDEASCPPHPGDDVVAAVKPPSLSNMPTSSLHAHLHEEGVFCHLADTEEDLPPYQSVLTETFVVSPAENPDSASLKVIQHCPNDRECQRIEACPNIAAQDDYIFFLTDSASLSEQESSVVGCFTEDFSDSSESLGALNFGSSTASSPQSLPILTDSVSDTGRLPDNEVDEWSERFVTDWISKFEGAWPYKGSPSANGDDGRPIEPASSQDCN